MAAPGLWAQFHRLFRWLRYLLIATSVLFALLLLAEAARLYQLAATAHPTLGYAWLLLIAAGGLLVGIPAYRFFQVPRVVKPPAIPEPKDLTLVHLRAEARYLDRYLANCLRNSELQNKVEDIRNARIELAEYSARLLNAGEGQLAELDGELREWAATTVSGILADVDKKAERIIYQEALTVGVGTAASPNGTLDAFVMLWRTVNLVSRLAVLYYGRPGPLGTLAICRDVSLAVALAGYLQSFTDSLGGLLAKSLGGVTGVVAGPLVEGLTNALVVVRIGYIAKERCRSFRDWDVRTRRSAVIAALNATQKVAVGLSSEIVRKVGVGVGAVAGAAASSVAQVANDLGQKISSLFRGKKKSPSES